MKKNMLLNKGKKTKIAAIAMLTAGSSLFAGTVDDGSFQDLYTVFQGWLEGSLGKLLALLGFIGTFIIYLMTHKGSVLFVGVLISLIAGGIVGISQTFFSVGGDTFQTTAP